MPYSADERRQIAIFNVTDYRLTPTRSFMRHAVSSTRLVDVCEFEQRKPHAFDVLQHQRADRIRTLTDAGIQHPHDVEYAIAFVRLADRGALVGCLHGVEDVDWLKAEL